MNRCLHCGAVKYGGVKPRYPCKCGAYTAKISRNMVKVAQQLHGLGFEITRAEDFIAVLCDADTEVKALLVHVDFTRIYDRRVFETLPDGWQYLLFEKAELPFSRIAELEHHMTFSVISAPKAIKHIITELSRWTRELESSGKAAVYRLSGWL